MVNLTSLTEISRDSRHQILFALRDTLKAQGITHPVHIKAGFYATHPELKGDELVVSTAEVMPFWLIADNDILTQDIDYQRSTERNAKMILAHCGVSRKRANIEAITALYSRGRRIELFGSFLDLQRRLSDSRLETVADSIRMEYPVRQREVEVFHDFYGNVRTKDLWAGKILLKSTNGCDPKTIPHLGTYYLF